MQIQITDIGHAIELAIAPVFLLGAQGTLLVVLTNRLGRIIDRGRVIEALRRDEHAAFQAQEIRSLHDRAYMINYSIWLCTISGLLVCLVIASLFVLDTTTLPLAQIIAILFVSAMFCMLGGFGIFLREITLCCRFMRMQQLAALAHTYETLRVNPI